MSGAPFPNTRMAAGVNDCNDFHYVAFNVAQHLVRKAASQNTSHVLVEHLVMERVFGGIAEGHLDFAEKFVTKALLALFIPIECLRHVRLGFGANEEAMAH